MTSIFTDKGTAMGTKFAPIFSTLVLGYLEEKLYANLEKEFDCQFKQYIIDNFKRFLDDCFMGRFGPVISAWVVSA